MPLSGVRVLCVDSNFDTCELLVTILQCAHATVITALSARDALSAFDEIKPDVLISDIILADDGYSLIRKIRSLPKEQGGQIPAIALTGYVRPQDRSLALSSGFQVFVSKPFDPAELVDTIVSLLNSPTAA